MKKAIWNKGVLAALLAAVLFGAGTPAAKLLLAGVGPWMLAGLFYLGSGLGLTLYRLLRGSDRVALTGAQWAWLGGAIAAGGVVGPLLLMVGLTGMPASGASLLLNAEGVFTALLAWLAFGENADRRIVLGMAAIALGAIVLSWPAAPTFAGALPALAILGACFAWGVDNNLTRKVALADASAIASIKGLVAGCVNVALAFAVGDHLPVWPTLGAAMVVGFLAYGVSLALFVVGLRHLGSARTGAYFSVAPFCGALLALAAGEAATPRLAIAGALMAVGVWLHLTERHHHRHAHEAMEHDHPHEHDAHHQHLHDDPNIAPLRPGQTHTHRHTHAPLEHEHDHYPDAHHQHRH